MNLYDIKNNCIFCNYLLTDEYFKTDKKIPLACFTNENITDDNYMIPYNIFTCKNCKSSQIKYYGNINLIYEKNHADSTGSIMHNLHKEVYNLIVQHIDNIHNFIEIGSSKSILADLLLPLCNKYYIVEPTYIGSLHNKKIIINDFYENVDQQSYEDANVMIISHVFEHFYNPMNILKIIENNINIEYFVLVWPNLEYYKDNNIYHVLNTEHTYYIDNNYLISLCNNSNFELIKHSYYENHSVIFIFKRNKNLSYIPLYNVNNSLTKYIDELINKKHNIELFINNNKNKHICIWPCSVHTQFLLSMCEISVDFILDNSPNKIDKYLYGYNIKCLSFEENINLEKNAIILNGGCFNKEIINKLFLNNYLII